MAVTELAAACRRMLDDHAIAYSVDATASQPAAVVARTLLLGDAQSKVQLLVRADRLADLLAINARLGRDLQVQSGGDAKEVLRGLGLSQLPGVPRVIGVPLLVDEALRGSDTVFLPGGQDAQWIRLSRSEFARLTSDCETIAASAPLPDTGDDGGSDQVHEAVSRFTTRRILDRLDATLNVPPLPEAARRIVQLQSKPDFNLSELTEIIETDAALASQIVGWANSPYYRPRGTVESIDDAIMRVLGFDLVMNLALGLAVGQTLRIPPGYEGGTFRYWLESVYTAAMCEALARCVPKGRVKPGLAYLAGLLHNFGFLVLAHAFPPHFRAVMTLRSANAHLPAAACEQFVLGISGEQIAGALLENWMLPEAVYRAVRYQGAPNSAAAADDAAYARLLALSRLLLRRHVEFLKGPIDDITEAELMRALDIDRARAEKQIETILESTDEFQEMARSLGR
jgi:HD-like signal output (HDOD) protein/prolyl-tRNA editing enzyme YbaK/EbsC (Cys-tRNA(Pro) deacylase)